MAKQYEAADEILDEELWEDDYLDDEEPDEGSIKEKARVFFGLGDSSEYDNTADYVMNHVMNNGIFGTLKGVFISVAAVASHALHVVINNVIFGGAEHFNFKRAIAEAKGHDKIAKETKDLKAEQKQKKETKEKTAEKDYGEKNPDKEQENNEEKKAVHEAPKFLQDLNTISTPEVGEYIKEMETNIAHIIDNPAELDDVLTVAFQYANMKPIFDEFNIVPCIDHESDRILLFQKDRENDLNHIPYIKKADLLNGNAQALGAALNKQDSKDDRNSSMLAAAKAVILSAKIKNEIYSEPLSDARKSMNDKNNDFIVLSYAITDCPNNTAGLLYTVLDQRQESVQLYYKNNYIGTIDLLTPHDVVADKIYEKMIAIDNTLEKNEYMIGDNISFSKASKETVSIVVNGDAKEFPLTQEYDMKAIAEFISEKCPDKADTARIDAMIIGAKMNPYMEKYTDEYGYPQNPFTEKVIERGDLILTQKDGMTSISMYDITVSNSIGLAGCTKEDIKEIAYIPMDGISYQTENIEKAVMDYMAAPHEEIEAEALTAMNALAFGSVEKEVSRPLELSQVCSGFDAYKNLSETALLDGVDISDLHVSEYQEEPEMEFDEMIKEAEEAMEMEGYEVELE